MSLEVFEEMSCRICNTPFTTYKNSTQKLCSRICANKSLSLLYKDKPGTRRGKKNKNKLVGKKIIRSPEKLAQYRITQSIGAKAAWRRPRKPTTIPASWRGKPPWNKGKTYIELLGAEKARVLSEKISQSNKTRPPYQLSDQGKQNLRDAALRDILAGKRHPHLNARKAKQVKITTKKGGLILCQSSWEVIFSKYLDNHELVKEFQKDRVRIPYCINGKRCIYIPDFLVTYHDSSQELIEVKPQDLITKENNPEKFSAAESWCARRGIDFVIITEDEIDLIDFYKERKK